MTGKNHKNNGSPLSKSSYLNQESSVGGAEPSHKVGLGFEPELSNFFLVHLTEVSLCHFFTPDHR
jgi:hypothetical protein